MPVTVHNFFSSLSLEDEEGNEARQEEIRVQATSRSSLGILEQHPALSTLREENRKKPRGPVESRKQEEEHVQETSLLKRPSLWRPLVWIDLEMTGLDLEKDRILEICCVVTDGKLATIIQGPDIVIHEGEEVLAAMNAWCQTHHKESGLVDKVRASTVSLAEAERQVAAFVDEHVGPGPTHLAGNSVYMDLMFLKKYMPTLANRFFHVLVDVSSIRTLCQRWYPRDAEKMPKKEENHRALSDILESIDELKYFQKTIFKRGNR